MTRFENARERAVWFIIMATVLVVIGTLFLHFGPAKPVPNTHWFILFGIYAGVFVGQTIPVVYYKINFEKGTRGRWD